MMWLSDEAAARLRDAGSEPDLSGTPYRLIERLGRGGMGTVYLVEDARLGRRVALKVIDLPGDSRELEARLLREARILAQLEHPGIVPVHEVGSLSDGRVFYTMKVVQGRRLDEVAREPASRPERLRLFQKICEPVAFAHARGVLHRDLKPENIMVGPFGEVLVMDWGIAKILAGEVCSASSVVEDAKAIPAAAPATATATDHARSSSPANAVSAGITPESQASANSGGVAPALPETADGAVVGTAGYMAPEQARGEIQRLDRRADIYALGAILRFLLAAPSAATADGESSTAVPRRLNAIVSKAMAANPESRYSSAQDLAADITADLDGLPVSAYPEGILQRAARVISRNRVAVGLVLAYLLARILLILFRTR